MLRNTIISKEALEYIIPKDGVYLPIRTQDGELIGTCKISNQSQNIKISDIHICDPTMEKLIKSEQKNISLSIDGRILHRDTQFQALALENIVATLDVTKSKDEESPKILKFQIKDD